MTDPRDKISNDFLEVAKDLIADAKHLSNKNVPRGCAHLTATQGSHDKF